MTDGKSMADILRDLGLLRRDNVENVVPVSRAHANTTSTSGESVPGPGPSSRLSGALGRTPKMSGKDSE